MAIASTFGMKASVCSWIEVTAWMIDAEQREGDLQRQAHRLGREGDDRVLVHQ
jgi:hypothetical protein